MENQKQLFRIKNGREVLGGVAQGLAEHLNLDVVLIRVLFVLLFFFGGGGLLIYLILWVVLPKKDIFSSNFTPSSIDESQSLNPSFNMENKKNGSIVGGLVLIVLGIIFAFKEYAEINLFSYIGKAWPLFFIGLGAWLILKEKGNSNTNSNF